jgi:hypothetical protein
MLVLRIKNIGAQSGDGGERERKSEHQELIAIGGEVSLVLVAQLPTRYCGPLIRTFANNF